MLQVLLVEPSNMVRQCLLHYLRRQGMQVCAVKSEEQAIAHLRLQGTSSGCAVHGQAAAVENQTSRT